MIVEIRIGIETMTGTGIVIADMAVATLGRIETGTMTAIVIGPGTTLDVTGTDLATLDGIVETGGTIGGMTGTGETTEIGEMIGRGDLLIDGMTATGDLLTGETTGLERALHQGGQNLQSPGVLAPAEVNGMPRPPGLEATLMPLCKAG